VPNSYNYSEIAASLLFSKAPFIEKTKGGTLESTSNCYNNDHTDLISIQDYYTTIWKSGEMTIKIARDKTTQLVLHFVVTIFSKSQEIIDDKHWKWRKL
jgi:hypothetical protein